MLKAIYARNGGRPVIASTEAEIAAFHKEQAGTLWVDLEAASDEERGILSRVFAFHPLAIEHSIERTNHPRIDDYGEYLYLVVHGVAPIRGGALLGESRVTVSEVDFFLGRHFLVTFHLEAQRSLEAVRAKCGQVDVLLQRGPDRILGEILDHIADEYIDVIEHLDDEIDMLEDRLFKRASKPALREIFSLKKDVLHLRRVVNPQREVLNRLARMDHPVVSKEEAIYFRDVYDHIYRVSEMLDSFRDLLSGAMEVYLTVVSNRLNEIMKVLTVFSIIVMSASFIAGIYGMNVPLPGMESKYAFWVLIAGMLALSGLLLFLFRKRRWL